MISHRAAGPTLPAPVGVLSEPALAMASRTGAGVPLKRLAQASGLSATDRLLVTGSIPAEVLADLARGGAAALTLVQPGRPYPNPDRADVVWVLSLDDAAAFEQRLRLAFRCLAPGARLLAELCTPDAISDAPAVAARLRHQGLELVRIEVLKPAVVLVRGCAPVEHCRHQRRAA